jgi:hypothetical protein
LHLKSVGSPELSEGVSGQLRERADGQLHRGVFVRRESFECLWGCRSARGDRCPHDRLRRFHHHRMRRGISGSVCEGGAGHRVYVCSPDEMFQRRIRTRHRLPAHCPSRIVDERVDRVAGARGVIDSRDANLRVSIAGESCDEICRGRDVAGDGATYPPSRIGGELTQRLYVSRYGCGRGAVGTIGGTVVTL